MKRVLLLTGVLLTLGVSGALAGGVSLNWGTVCFSEAPNSQAMDFSCNTNSGNWSMVSTFVLDAEMSDMAGVEITMLGTSLNEPNLVDWWKLGGEPDCRAGKATFTPDFSTVAGYCQDWSAGRTSNVFQYTWEANHAHIAANASLSDSTPFDVLPDQEYYAGKVTILNGKTVGAGACSGCNECFAWDLTRITVVGLNGRRDDLTTPLSDAYHTLVLWHGCQVPTRSTTWGQIKSLYR